MKRLDTETKVAVLTTDGLCLGCYSSDHEHSYPVYIEIPLDTGGKVYSHAVISLCLSCVKTQDYNKVKRNLNYWLLESIVVKLDV